MRRPFGPRYGPLMQTTFAHLIDGALVPGAKQFDVIDPATAPFGGVKWSGIGRENGRWGIEEFCELQVVNASRV